MNDEINSGELNKKIQIQEKTITVNENGYPVDVWTNLISPYAKIENTNGSKFFNSGSENIKKISKFTIRYNSILKDKNEKNLRIVYSNRNFTIQYINDPKEKHKFFEIVGEYIGC